MEGVIHSIPPVWDANSKILILGSFPSVKSREQGFFYGHKQNRFWQTLAYVLSCRTPQTVEEKTAMLLKNGIALWDVIASCTITGSSDASIKNAIPNDLTELLDGARIGRIYTNGKTAHKLYCRYLEPKIQMPAECLPSTSPANAAWTQERLNGAWRVILQDTDNSHF